MSLPLSWGSLLSMPVTPAENPAEDQLPKA